MNTDTQSKAKAETVWPSATDNALHIAIMAMLRAEVEAAHAPLQVDPHALTERQRIVAFIAARLYPLVFSLGDARTTKASNMAVTLAGKMLDEVIRQNP